MSAPASYLIQNLFLYPIKSARGIEVDRLDVTVLGPRFDREWMIVDDDGQFQTQRKTPMMAQIETALLQDHLQVRIAGQDFQIPLSEDPQSPPPSAVPVRVWNDSLVADEVGHPGLNAAISQLLRKNCRLVRFGGQSRRQVQKAGVTDTQFRFADAANFLVATTASLEDLNQRLSAPVPMARFRPNIVLKTDLPWSEDHWTTMHAGDVRLQFAGGCGRCQIITQDPETGDLVSKEPLQRLAEFRRQGPSVMFGMHAVPLGFGNEKLSGQLSRGQWATIETQNK